MKRLKPEFDVLEKIERERLSRGWSEYTLAKNSGLTPSTISTWYRKNLQPSITSIEKICMGLDITLSQFFSSSDPNSDKTSNQQELNELWKRLNANQKRAVIDMLKSFLSSSEE